jgi:hypothetical protein
MFVRLFLIAGLLLASASASAQQQQIDWRELALRAQQNATTDQMIAAGIIAGLQAEIVQLKAKAPAPPAQPGATPAQPDENK